MVQVLHSTRPKARKDHQCTSCERVIARGETYQRQDCVFDEHRYSYLCCEQCEVAFSWAWTEPNSDWDEGLHLPTWFEESRFDDLTHARFWVYLTRQWRRLDGTLVDARTLLPAPATTTEPTALAADPNLIGDHYVQTS